MPIASRFADGTICVIDGEFVASLVGGRWERGLKGPAEASVSAADEDAVMLAMQARAALGATAAFPTAALLHATL